MTRIADIIGFEVEHGFGAVTQGPFVKVRVLGDEGPVALGQISIEDALNFARDLMVTAGRAEYEGDLHDELTRTGMPDDLVGSVMIAARIGEARRHG